MHTERSHLHVHPVASAQTGAQGPHLITHVCLNSAPLVAATGGLSKGIHCINVQECGGDGVVVPTTPPTCISTLSNTEEFLHTATVHGFTSGVHGHCVEHLSMTFLF